MNSLRALPSVDQLLRQLEDLNVPHALLRDTARAVLNERRAALRNRIGDPETDIVDEVRRRLARLLSASLRPVINATGIILHTNLGRAPLPDFRPIARYSNLEYDLETGKRGKRDTHVAPLLEALLKRPAFLVNNNAAAVFLVLHELASGREVIVSRGELIEIGDGFRIPEIMSRSSAILREVGTTNRTRIEDYASAVTERTALILRVHPSNFHVSGFTARPDLGELCALSRERGVPIYEDLGSGNLVDLSALGVSEPVVGHSLEAGVNVVSFSCDKLLGGPQSGIIAGDAALLSRIRKNPMYRAFRVDKLVIEAMESTLRRLLLGDWTAIPTLGMITAAPDRLRARAERIAAGVAQLKPEIVESESPIGGGSTPSQSLPTYLVRIPTTSAAAFERRLRAAPIPVIARIEKEQIVFDMRTVADEEEQSLISAALAAEGC
ncbi:MAG TPA: L-seryl-tRNA(Sec) selenium transferase [Bryobacteraceae bacterium]|nr:L-seryl-tRNA(Sec) selenium transferase [Bryobacteraceae bacterium]